MNKTVFISYCWQEPSGGIVNNWLKPSLKKADIDVSVDKDNCQYQDSIEQYEQEIGNADMIIAVVGRSYIESVNCMYEMASIIKNGRDLSKRLFFIELEKIQSNEQICEHWEDVLAKAENNLIGKKTGRKLFEKELNQIKLICNNLGDFLDYWKDRNRLDFSKVSEKDFQVVINKIKNRFDEVEIPMGDLMKPAIMNSPSN